MNKLGLFLFFLVSLKSLQCAEVKPQVGAITYTTFQQKSPGVVFVPGIGSIDIAKGPVNCGLQSQENKKK